MMKEPKNTLPANLHVLIWQGPPSIWDFFPQRHGNHQSDHLSVEQDPGGPPALPRKCGEEGGDPRDSQESWQTVAVLCAGYISA